jgi:hypothetical protein
MEAYSTIVKEQIIDAYNSIGKSQQEPGAGGSCL